MQETINIVETYAKKNCFKLSSSKTSMLNFTKSTYQHPLEVRIGNTSLQNSNIVRYLSPVFDPKLDWKAQYSSWNLNVIGLNLMRSVSSTLWGADQRSFMMILRSLLQSKRDSGCIVYSSSNCTALSSLELLANKAMRIASRCFKNTPKISLQVVTKETSLQIKRDKLSLKYYLVFKFVTLEQEALY